MLKTFSALHSLPGRRRKLREQKSAACFSDTVTLWDVRNLLGTLVTPAYRQPGINCKGRLRRGRTDFSRVTIHHSVFIASGILQGIEKVSARRYNHFSHRCFKQVEPREKTAASVKNLLRTASGYFCTPPVGCAHYRDLNWTKGPLRSPQPGCCYTLQT